MGCETDAPWFGAGKVSFSHGEYPVLRDMELAVAPGQIHALVGMHNSGKSTLCSMLAGKISPQSGCLFAAGRRHASLTPKLARELGIALVATPSAVFSRLSVMENLVAGKTRWWLGFFPRRTYERTIRDWLDANGIELPLHRSMRDLPRDYWIAVEILSRLFSKPRFLILDEVLEELNQEWKKRIRAIMDGLIKDGMSVLIATQKIEEALSSAHSLTVIRQGHAILTGRTGGMERLNLIRLCYDQLDRLDEDFSERESFQELMRYTSAMLNDLPTAVLVFDNDFNARFVNRRARELFPAFTGTVGMPLRSIGNARLIEFVEKAGTGAASVPEELHSLPVRGGNGDCLVDVRIQPILEHGVTVGMMVVVEDVSLREDLRRRLMLSEKLASIGLLAAGVAHEVNNPLEIIGNYINYLDEEELGPGARKAVAKMMNQVDRIYHIVNNLVAYSGKKPDLSLGADPVELLEELVDLLRYGADFSDITFRMDREGDGPVLVAIDPNELRQVFLNLIRNSLDAMPNGGVISFSVRAEPDAGIARIVSRDTGGGLNLDNPNDIFLPFVTTKKGEGTHQGLGLYLVYGIVEKYSGTISVRNHPDGGCEFSVVLPLA